MKPPIKSHHETKHGSGRPPTPPLAKRSAQVWLGLIVSLLFVSQLWLMISRHQDNGLNRVVDTPSGQIAAQININTATQREFALLPSVGPILAQRIVVDRDKHGPFDCIDDLDRVHGIGEKKILQLSVYCVVEH